MKLYFENKQYKSKRISEDYYKDRDDEFEYYLDRNDIDFNYNSTGEYIFQSVNDARTALRLARDLGYTSSWRETNIVYLVDKGN